MRPFFCVAILGSAILGTHCGLFQEPETGATAASVASAPSSHDAGGTPPDPLTIDERIDTERTLELGDGARMPLIVGWTLATEQNTALLRDPDRSITLVVSVRPRGKADSLVAELAARARIDLPKAPFRSKQSDDPDPWAEVVEVSHTPPMDTDRVIRSVVRSSGDRSVSMIWVGSQASLSKRAAELGQMLGGLKLAGVEPESVAGRSAKPLEGDRARAFATFVESARAALQVPGVSVAVVQRGKTVFAKGFGSRTHGKSEPVDERTRFMIGSVTKSLSTLMIAGLVDDKKLSWDTRLVELEPKLAIGDDALRDKLTLADTFCGCTGMPRRDLDMLFQLRIPTNESVRTMFDGVGPTTKWGETFQYSNQMTALGGYLAARKAAPNLPPNRAYETTMHKRVLRPMGMHESTASFREGSRPGNVATPHGTTLDGVANVPTPLPMSLETFVEAVEPAGSVWSTASDMARYALVELSLGKSPDGSGKQLFAPENVAKRRAPRTKTGPDKSYGLGFGVSQSLGLGLVQHDGGTMGFSSRFVLFPDQDMGLVILTNRTGKIRPLLDGVVRRLVELTLDAKPKAEAALARAASAAQGDKDKPDVRSRLATSLAQGLAGRYASPRLGSVVLRVSDEKAGDGGESKTVWLETPMWKSRVGLYADASKGESVVLALLDPPLAGLPIRFVRAPKPKLIIKYEQDTFEFDPVSSP